MRDYSFIISPIRATGQTPAPRIPRFAARRFLSATVYCIKIKKDTNALTNNVSYKIAFENSYKKNIFNISVYNNGIMLMNNDNMKLKKLISILDEAYKNHCE